MVKLMVIIVKFSKVHVKIIAIFFKRNYIIFLHNMIPLIILHIKVFKYVVAYCIIFLKSNCVFFLY